MLNVITSDRVVNSNFRRQINDDKCYICERHFLPGGLYILRLSSSYVTASEQIAS